MSSPQSDTASRFHRAGQDYTKFFETGVRTSVATRLSRKSGDRRRNLWILSWLTELRELIVYVERLKQRSNFLDFKDYRED
jgi:hypothetical protein